LADLEGFEPSTFCSRDRRSTNCAIGQCGSPAQSRTAFLSLSARYLIPLDDRAIAHPANYIHLAASGA
jgi:hypothetical protein